MILCRSNRNSQKRTLSNLPSSSSYRLMSMAVGGKRASVSGRTDVTGFFATTVRRYSMNYYVDTTAHLVAIRTGWRCCCCLTRTFFFQSSRSPATNFSLHYTSPAQRLANAWKSGTNFRRELADFLHMRVYSRPVFAHVQRKMSGIRRRMCPILSTFDIK